MYEVLLIVFLLVAVSLIGLIMLQHGKGADMGSAFGSGVSTRLFGFSDSGNFMTRMTAVLATIFFISSLTLDNLNNNEVINNKGNNWENLIKSEHDQRSSLDKLEETEKDIP